MATAGKGLLLDTSIVVRHFREAGSVVDRLSEYEELYLPHAALAELYAGAYRSARPEKNLAQISRFLEAVDVITPDDSTPEVYGRISAQLAKAESWNSDSPERHLDFGDRLASGASARHGRPPLREGRGVGSFGLVA